MKRRTSCRRRPGCRRPRWLRRALRWRRTAKVLRFIPQANLSSLDAVAGTQYVVRNAAMLVWDTLYGVHSKLEPKPQMAESAEPSADGLTWTFKLRAGLLFHDGAPVLPKDVIASLKRWMVRDSMGQIIAAQTGRDGRPGRPHGPHPHEQAVSQDAVRARQGERADGLIMPERIAATDPFKLITEFVGSGPMKFAKDEWVPGSKAVFTRFEATCRATRRPTGRPAASGCISTASSGTSSATRPPRPARCRTARWIGGRTRSPTWCRC